MKSKLSTIIKTLIPTQLKRAIYSKASVIVPNHFMTYHLRPKYAKDVHTVSASTIKKDQLAIIIQGPLNLINNFTIESIKLYNKIFKGAKIILSTWEDENEKSILIAKNLDCVVLLNKKPKNTYNYFHPSSGIMMQQGGPGNINLQLITTKSAILLAKDMGIEYCFKTRTDLRFYRHDLFDFFLSLMKAFPLDDTSLQKNRLITSSFNTLKYKLYCISDTLMFGNTRDMLNYWGAEHYEEGIKPYIDTVKMQIPPIVSGMAIWGDTYLAIKYLESLGIEPEWTLQHFWKICGKYFCIVDAYSLDMYFDKYEKLNEHRYTRDYKNSNPRAMEFADWLQLYTKNEVKWEGVCEKEIWKVNNGIYSQMVSIPNPATQLKEKDV